MIFLDQKPSFFGIAISVIGHSTTTPRAIITRLTNSEKISVSEERNVFWGSGTTFKFALLIESTLLGQIRVGENIFLDLIRTNANKEEKTIGLSPLPGTHYSPAKPVYFLSEINETRFRLKFSKNIDGDRPVGNESASGPVLLCL